MNQNAKGLSLFALTMIAIGATIGSGIFKTPSSIADKVGDNTTIIMLWILGGVVSLLGALVFAEFGSRFSNAGGVYTYLNKAYGPLPGFLYGWCLLTVISSGTIAALCTVFAENLSYFIEIPDENEKYVAMSSVVVLTLFNTFGIKSSEWFANVGTVLKIIGIYALLLLALFLGDKMIFAHSSEIVDAVAPPKEDNLAGAFVGVLWSYTGWHYASFVSGEARNPKRNIPLAMLFGTGAVTITYVLCNMGYFKVIDHDTIASFANAENPKVVGVEAMNAIMPGVQWAMPALIGLSVFACAGLYILSTPRIFNQMALEGLFFKTFAKKHEKFGVPVNAIILQSVWAIVLIYLWGSFSSIIEYVTFVEWLFLLTACIGIFLIRSKYPNEKPAFRVPLYPVIPALFIVVVSWFIYKNALADKAEYYAGLAVIPIGIVFYYIFKTRMSKKVEQ
ncbi:MAG: amino acid permease [Flavobacteriales bacterium]|nr:amino acid permease [Flavobacteriales bacterium]